MKNVMLNEAKQSIAYSKKIYDLILDIIKTRDELKRYVGVADRAGQNVVQHSDSVDDIPGNELYASIGDIKDCLKRYRDDRHYDYDGSFLRGSIIGEYQYLIQDDRYVHRTLALAKELAKKYAKA